MGIKERLRRLEERQAGDFKENLGFLKLMYKTLQGPPSAEIMNELEERAREMTAQGVVFSMAQFLREVDGKGYPRPGNQVEGKVDRR